MKKQPIHQNLNTSFVNVGALVRYLRRLQFVGSIRVELSSYEADIVFTSKQMIQAREYDHIAGRIAHGEQALQRILIRCKEPHGRIHVYKSVEGYAGTGDGSVFVDKVILVKAREMAASVGGASANGKATEFILNVGESENAQVLAALSDLLRTVDEALERCSLSFASAFELSCNAIAASHPFMQGKRRALVYSKGEIRLNVQANPSSVAEAVFAALAPIFRRLRTDRKYELLYLDLTESLRDSSVARRNEYVRLGLMRHIEALLVD
ncbi:MAG: hypothetical protein DMF63_18750 [Acidobacteria bacterium]|nr:MAG: hypothetical protein DMF63_18750 [Acidobacteriota bacterium]